MIAIEQATLDGPRDWLTWCEGEKASNCVARQHPRHPPIAVGVGRQCQSVLRHSKVMGRIVLHGSHRHRAWWQTR